MCNTTFQFIMGRWFLDGSIHNNTQNLLGTKPYDKAFNAAIDLELINGSFKK